MQVAIINLCQEEVTIELYFQENDLTSGCPVEWIGPVERSVRGMAIVITDYNTRNILVTSTELSDK